MRSTSKSTLALALNSLTGSTASGGGETVDVARTERFVASEALKGLETVEGEIIRVTEDVTVGGFKVSDQSLIEARGFGIKGIVRGPLPDGVVNKASTEGERSGGLREFTVVKTLGGGDVKGGNGVGENLNIVLTGELVSFSGDFKFAEELVILGTTPEV